MVLASAPAAAEDDQPTDLCVPTPWVGETQIEEPGLCPPKEPGGGDPENPDTKGHEFIIIQDPYAPPCPTRSFCMPDYRGGDGSFPEDPDRLRALAEAQSKVWAKVSKEKREKAKFLAELKASGKLKLRKLECGWIEDRANDSHPEWDDEDDFVTFLHRATWGNQKVILGQAREEYATLKCAWVLGRRLNEH